MFEPSMSCLAVRHKPSITCKHTSADSMVNVWNLCAGHTDAADVHIPPPAILKPRQLWTGKQLLSAVVSYFSRGKAPLTFSAGSKVPADYWGKGNGEGEFVFYKGQLVAGCLDKSQFGKYGLVHAMQVSVT